MEESDNKKKSKAVLYFAVFILLISGAFVFYMVATSESNEGVWESTEQAENIVQTNEEAAETEETLIIVDQPQAGTQANENGVDTSEYKTQIDKDLQTLDSLDLSGAENDFSDDNIPDL